ncbi:MAG: hypothetical protein QM778_05555 [Myxococcales bacterium]
MLIISLLLLVLMAIGFIQLVGTVRALFGLFGRRWADAERLSRYALLTALVAYPLITTALFYAQLHWGPAEAAASRDEALARTISATMNFGIVGVLSVPLAALVWLVAFSARTRQARQDRSP